MTPTASRRLGLGLIFFFWALVACTDFPAPFTDDAAYIGAGINLARHGVFSNPLCPNLAAIDSDQHFYAYMPLHSYVLAGWLMLAGISTVSFHIFHTALAFLIALLIYQLLPVARQAWAFAILVSVALYGLLNGVGLRPDSLGLVFFLLGVGAFWSRSLGSFFVKNLFLGLALITFPNVGLLALVVTVSALAHRLMLGRETPSRVMRAALVAGAAYGVAFLVFLACIQGHLPEFLRSMALGQKMSAQGVHNRFHLFTAMGVAKWIVVQAAFFLLVLTLLIRRWQDPRRGEERFFLVVSLLAFLALGFSSFSSATGAHLWAFGCLAGGWFIIARESWNWTAWAGWCVVFAIGVFGHDHIAVEDCLAAKPPGIEKRAALLAEIASMHPPRLYLDTYAMRELYDYRLPENAFCYEWSNTSGWAQPSSVDTLPRDSVSIVSVKNALSTKASPDAEKQRRPLEFLHHPIHDMYLNPYDLVIIDNRS